MARNLNENLLLSTWVYLDEQDTSHNVIYVGLLLLWLILLIVCILQLDQPELGLPHSMYLDLDSYADYITAYKTFMFDVAKIVAGALESSVSDEEIMADVEKAFEFETSIALVSKSLKSSVLYELYFLDHDSRF